MKTKKTLKRSYIIAIIAVIAAFMLTSVCYAADERDGLSNDLTVVEATDGSGELPSVTEEPETSTSKDLSTDVTAEDERAEVEEQIKDAIGKTDEYLSGNLWWESAKAWIIDNLSTVAGLVMAVAAIGAAIFAKIGLIPRAVNTVNAFGSSCQNKFDEIISAVEADTRESTAFIKEARAVLEKMKEQSDENEALRLELSKSREELLSLEKAKSASEQALTESCLLLSSALESVIEISSIAQVRKDAIYSQIEQAKQRIRELGVSEEV